MPSVTIKEESVEKMDQNILHENSEVVLREKLNRTEERLRQMEDYNVDLRAQLASVKSEKVVKREIDGDLKQLYDQLKYKDTRILELNNVIMEKERRIIDLQELCREQNQVAKSKKMAVQIVNKRLQELDDRQMKDVGTEIDSALLSSSRERSSRIGGGSVSEDTHKRNESPGRAIPLTRGKNGSPPPIDPSEDFGLSGEDSWSENISEGVFFAKKFADRDGKGAGGANGRKRVTFDFAQSGDAMRRSRSNRSSSAERVTRREHRNEFSAKNELKNDSAASTELQFLLAENDLLRHTIEEMQKNTPVTKAEQISVVKSDLKEIQEATELEKCQQDGRAKVLKARAAAQSRIRELEENIAGLQLSSAKEADNLKAINETLKASREWLLNENGNLLKKNEDLRCKIDDLLGELDATLATSALFRGRLEESEKRIDALGGELAEVRRSLHQASETKQILHSEVERLKEAIFAQDEFISVLEGDLIVYEAHVGILRDSLGASKKEDRQIIKSKAFAAKLNALEMEKQAIVKRSNDERLRTKALSVKIRCLEQERSELLQRIRHYEQLHGSNRDQHIQSNHNHEQIPQNLPQLQSELPYNNDVLRRKSSFRDQEKNEQGFPHPSLSLVVHPQPLVPLQAAFPIKSSSEFIDTTQDPLCHDNQSNEAERCKTPTSTTSSPFAPILPSPQHNTSITRDAELESHEIDEKCSLDFVAEPTAQIGANEAVHSLPQAISFGIKSEREDALALSLQESANNLLSHQLRLKEVENELDALREDKTKLIKQLQQESGMRSSINQKVGSILQNLAFEGVDEQGFDEITKLERLPAYVSNLKKNISDLLEKRASDQEEITKIMVDLSAATASIDELNSANSDFLTLTKELEAQKHELSESCVTLQDKLSACEAQLLRAQNLLSESSSNIRQFEQELFVEREQCAALREAKELAEFRLNEVDKQLLEMMVDKENFEQKLSILQDNNSYLTATLDREKGRLERLVDLLRHEVDRFRVEAELSRTCLEDLRLNSASVSQQHQQQQNSFYLHQQEQQIQLHQQQERDRIVFEQQQQHQSNMNNTAANSPPLPPLREQGQIQSNYPNCGDYGSHDRPNINAVNANLQLGGITISRLREIEHCELASNHHETSFNSVPAYIGPETNHAEINGQYVQDLSNIAQFHVNPASDGNASKTNFVKKPILSNLDRSELQETSNKANIAQSIDESDRLEEQQGDNFHVHCEKKPELVTAMPDENVTSSDTNEIPLTFALPDHTDSSQAMDLEVSITNDENVSKIEENSLNSIQDQHLQTNSEIIEHDDTCKVANTEILELSKAISEIDNKAKVYTAKDELLEESNLEVSATDDFVSNVMEDINRLVELKTELETSVDVLKAEIWSLNGQLRKQLCEHEEVVIRLKTCEELLAASNEKLLVQDENVTKLRNELSMKSTQFDNILQENLKIEAESVALDAKCAQLQEQLVAHHITVDELTEATRLVAILESENKSLKSNLNDEKSMVGQLRLELEHKSEQLIQLQLEKFKIGEESNTLMEQLNELQESYEALVAKANVSRSDQSTETTLDLPQSDEFGKKLDPNTQPEKNTTSSTATSMISSKTVSLPLLNTNSNSACSKKLKTKYGSASTPVSCSLVHPVNMQLAILAARFDSKCSDNDSLFRTNTELAHTNSRLLNTIDELEAKIRVLMQSNSLIRHAVPVSQDQKMEPIIETEAAALKFQKRAADPVADANITKGDLEEGLLRNDEREKDRDEFSELIEECFDSVEKSENKESIKNEEVVSKEAENVNNYAEKNVEANFICPGLQDLTIAETAIAVKSKKSASEYVNSTVPALAKKKKIKAKVSHSVKPSLGHIQGESSVKEVGSSNLLCMDAEDENVQNDRKDFEDKQSDKIHFGPLAATRFFDVAFGSAAKVSAAVACAASEAATAVSEIAIAQNVSTSHDNSNKLDSLLDGLKSFKTKEERATSMPNTKLDVHIPENLESDVGLGSEEDTSILTKDTFDANLDDNNWDWNETNWVDDTNDKLDDLHDRDDLSSNSSGRISVVHKEITDNTRIENEEKLDRFDVSDNVTESCEAQETGNENEEDESWDW